MIVNMKKNKKFQKEQLAEQGYTDITEVTMAESMQGLKRTHRCGELSAANAGEKVTIMGWVQKNRNKGGLVFVDVRDRSGIIQVVVKKARQMRR